MKKEMVYVTALILSLMALLSGCGAVNGSDGKTVPPTQTPTETVFPETMMPEPEDGVVRDRDGFITDNDGETSRNSGTENGTKKHFGTAERTAPSQWMEENGKR